MREASRCSLYTYLQRRCSAQKQAASNAIADTMQSINAAAVQQKDNLESNVRAQNAALNEQIRNSYGQQAQAIQNMAQQVGNVGSNIMSNLIK